MGDKTPLLELTDVRMAYRAAESGNDLEVLSGVSVRLHGGETLAITGPVVAEELTVYDLPSKYMN